MNVICRWRSRLRTRFELSIYSCLVMKRLAFKYRSGDNSTLLRDLESLRQSRFYAAKRAALNDPFEGRFDRSAFDRQLEAIEVLLKTINKSIGGLGDVKSAANNLLAFVDKSGIFSLSYNPLNELIWAHYGGSHKGFCIGYDLDKLIEFEPAQFHCIDVAYRDSSPLIQAVDLLIDNSPVKILQKLLGTKSSPWRYEQEVRVIATPPGLHEYDFRAVKEIYFGLCCPQETCAAVMYAVISRSRHHIQASEKFSSFLRIGVRSYPRYICFRTNLWDQSRSNSSRFYLLFFETGTTTVCRLPHKSSRNCQTGAVLQRGSVSRFQHFKEYAKKTSDLCAVSTSC